MYHSWILLYEAKHMDLGVSWKYLFLKPCLVTLYCHRSQKLSHHLLSWADNPCQLHPIENDNDPIPIFIGWWCNLQDWWRFVGAVRLLCCLYLLCPSPLTPRQRPSLALVRSQMPHAVPPWAMVLMASGLDIPPSSMPLPILTSHTSTAPQQYYCSILIMSLHLVIAWHNLLRFQTSKQCHPCQPKAM